MMMTAMIPNSIGKVIQIIYKTKLIKKPPKAGVSSFVM
jgi:hypothetical protein